MDSLKICIKAWVSGKVQGVYFRAFTQECAEKLKITGWVRNLSDGRVETVACGLPKDIQLFLEDLRKGPPSSQVSEVCWEEVSPQTCTETNSFMIKK